MAKVLLGERPERPNNLTLTNELWALAQQCLNGDPRRRPEIAEVVCCLQRALAVRRSVTGAETSTKGTLHSVFSAFRGISQGFQHRESTSPGSRGGVQSTGIQSTSCPPRNLLKKALPKSGILPSTPLALRWHEIDMSDGIQGPDSESRPPPSQPWLPR